MPHRPLRQQIFLRFLAIVALMGIPALAAAIYWFGETVQKEALDRVQQDLLAAHKVVAARILADGEVLDSLGRSLDASGYLDSGEASAVARTCGFDVMGMFSPDSRTGQRLLSGRPIDPSSDVILKWSRLSGGGGFMLLPLSELVEENPGRALNILHQQKLFPERGLDFRRDQVLLAMSWAESPARAGRGPRVLYAGRVINLNQGLVENLRSLVFQDESHRGRPVGTVTLFQGGVRVATNVVGPDGRVAVGTPVSETVFQLVHDQGRRWVGVADVVGVPYYSAYEPLRSPSGEVVGMVYVGLLEERFTSIRNRILGSFLLIFSLAVPVVVALSYMLSRRMSTSLAGLLAGTHELNQGKMDVELSVPFDAPREAAELMESFQGMVRTLRARDACLQEANERLRGSNDRLEVLNRSYMEMLGFVTHELSNMVGVMMLDAHSLRDALSERLDEPEKEMLLSLLNYLDRFRGMIRNYLDLSRIEKGRMEVHPVRLNLYWDILSLVQREMAPQLQKTSMKVEVADSAQDVDLMADPNLIRIVFYNLMHNAVKYGFDGGQIRISASTEDGMHTIEVWNEGLGIPEEELPHLFEKFYRSSSGEADRRGGTGLGLFITKKIIERHGGQIGARSRLGEWAAFDVVLPVPENEDSTPSQ